MIREAVANSDANALADIVDSLAINDALRELTHLAPTDRDQAMAALPAELAAELIEEAPVELANELLGRLDAPTAANIVDELHSDARADIIAELEEETANAILDVMVESDAAQARRLASYDPDSAGGLMIEEVLTFHDRDRVGEVFRRLAADDEDFEGYQRHHPDILDAADQLVGVVSLPEMLSVRRTTELRQIMTEPLTVLLETTLDDLRDFFDKHAFPAVPVVSAEHKLLGVVSRQACRACYSFLARQGAIACVSLKSKCCQNCALMRSPPIQCLNHSGEES